MKYMQTCLALVATILGVGLTVALICFFATTGVRLGWNVPF